MNPFTKTTNATTQFITNQFISYAMGYFMLTFMRTWYISMFKQVHISIKHCNRAVS